MTTESLGAIASQDLAADTKGSYWTVTGKRQRKRNRAYLDNAEDEGSTRAIITHLVRAKAPYIVPRGVNPVRSLSNLSDTPSDEDAQQALMLLATAVGCRPEKKQSPLGGGALWMDRAQDRPWTPEEDQLLREAIDANRTPGDRPKWRVVASIMSGRSDAMCRNRWARIMAGLRDPGQNRCTRCGLIRKGHTCINPEGAERVKSPRPLVNVAPSWGEAARTHPLAATATHAQSEEQITAGPQSYDDPGCSWSWRRNSSALSSSSASAASPSTVAAGSVAGSADEEPAEHLPVSDEEDSEVGENGVDEAARQEIAHQ